MAARRSSPALRIARLILPALCLSLFAAACNSTTSPQGGSSTPPGGGQTSGTPSVFLPPTTTPNSSPTTTTSPLAGTWNGTYTSTTDRAYGTFSMTWTVTGTRISGPIDIKNSACISKGTISGTLNGNHISFGAVHGAQTISYTGTVNGNSMSGTYSAPDCGRGKGTWTATKAP